MGRSWFEQKLQSLSFILYLCAHFFALQMCPDINNWLKLLSLHGKKKKVIAIVVCLFSFSTMDASMLALLLEASDDSEFQGHRTSWYLLRWMFRYYHSSSHLQLQYDCPKQLFYHRIEGFYKNDISRYIDPTFKAHFRLERTTFQV